MNGATYTPGPWRLAASGDIVTTEGGTVASLSAAGADSLAQEAQNGRLIAAAPELLRVARLALEELEWLSVHTPPAIRADLRRVIADATRANTTERKES